MVYGETGFLINPGAFDLRRDGYNIVNVEGWDSWPGLKLTGAEYAGQHGERFDSRGFFKARDFVITMTVLPYAAAGGQTDSPAHHVQDNIDAILGALYQNVGGDLTLQRTMPDATVREIDVRPRDFFPVLKGKGVHGREFGIIVRAGYPFWKETGDVNSGAQTTTFVLTNNGNAPINDFQITFTATGRLTHDASGDYLETNTTAGIVLDVGARTAKVGSVFHDNEMVRNRKWWMQLEPGANNMTVSGGGNVTVVHRHHWL